MEQDELEALLPYATERQAEILDALVSHKGVRAAARALSVQHAVVLKAQRAVRKKAALHGVSPSHDMRKAVPDPFVVKGTSTYYDREGKPTQQWVKSRLDPHLQAEVLREAISAFIEDVPNIDAPAGPAEYQTDIVPWVQIGDAHIGMLAHAAETGENFDLKIAERELLAGVRQLIDELPFSDRIVINDLGDMTHYENFAATTEASGHVLDYDSRFPRMVRVYSRTMRAIVDAALARAQVVDVIINQGNHSRTNDIWMAEMLRVAYGHTGRVNVLNNESVFIGYRMGATLVMTHHGDKCKPQKLADVMATDFARDWGETQFRYIDTGHVHTNTVRSECQGAVVESFNILATGDRWAHDNGYRSRRAITCVLRSRRFGEVGRRLLPIEEVRARLESSGHAVQPGKTAFIA